MDFQKFSALTLQAFEPVEQSFAMTHKVKDETVIFHSDLFDVMIYMEDYFEVNIDFAFKMNHKKVTLRLLDVAEFLGLEESCIQRIRRNQFSADKIQAYARFIQEISGILMHIFEKLFQNENLLAECYSFIQSERETTECITASCGIRENRVFSYKGNTVTADNHKLTIHGLYECEIPFSAITQCRYKESLLVAKLDLMLRQKQPENPSNLICTFTNKKKAKQIAKRIQAFRNKV